MMEEIFTIYDPISQVTRFSFRNGNDVHCVECACDEDVESVLASLIANNACWLSVYGDVDDPFELLRDCERYNIGIDVVFTRWKDTNDMILSVGSIKDGKDFVFFLYDKETIDKIKTMLKKMKCVRKYNYEKSKQI